MSEIFISSQEEQHAATVETMRENSAQRTPKDAADMLTAGIDALANPTELQENRKFYNRMKGLTALRATVEAPNSNELDALAHRSHGALGYDPNVEIRKM